MTPKKTNQTLFDFGSAIVFLKAGARVARKGWNGKNMSIAYQNGYPEGIPCNANTAKAWGMKEGDLFKCRPYLQMKCADGTFQMWVASQSDILAEDWYIVDDAEDDVATLCDADTEEKILTITPDRETIRIKASAFKRVEIVPEL